MKTKSSLLLLFIFIWNVLSCDYVSPCNETLLVTACDICESNYECILGICVTGDIDLYKKANDEICLIKNVLEDLTEDCTLCSDGEDCAPPETVDVFKYFDYDLIEERYFQIYPYEIRDTSDFLFDYSEFVDNSLLVYVANIKETDADVNNYAIYVMGERHGSVEPVTFNIESGYPKIRIIEGKINDVNNNLIEIDFNSKPQNGFVIHDFDDGNWCFIMNVEDLRFDQILIGSGNKHGKLDVSRHSGIKDLRICRNKYNDHCPYITNCEECMNDSQCGWCESTQKCVFGEPSGPLDGSLCPSWKYSSSFSYKIEYNHPNNPVHYDIVTSNGESINIAANIYVDTMNLPVDLAIITPGLQYASKLLAISDELKRSLADFNDLHFSFGFYTPTLVLPCNLQPFEVGLFDNMVEILNSILDGDIDDGESIEVLKEAVQQLNWRENTRRIILILGNFPEVEPDPIRESLILHSVYPIFFDLETTIVSKLVNGLGFGSIVYNDDFIYSIQLALSSASMVVTKDSIEYYDDSSNWNITGLNPSSMRARMIATLFLGNIFGENRFHIHGLGETSIDYRMANNIQPINKEVEMQQNQVLDLNNELIGLVIDFESENNGKPMFIYISNFEEGKLYQYPDYPFTSYEQLEAIEGSGLVSNANSKVIFVPNEGEYSEKERPYTKFDFQIVDSCYQSHSATVSIKVRYVNEIKPVTNFYVIGESKQNSLIILQLGGDDEVGHNLISTIDNFIDGMILYQYDESLVDALNVNDIYRDINDLEGVLDNFADLIINELPTNVTDSEGRVIYIPPRNANSENKPPSNNLNPFIDYHVTQKDILEEIGYPYELLSSPTNRFPFSIKWVNQPPTVTDLSVDPFEDGCNFGSTCNFDQNLGAYHPNSPGYVNIYGIAEDIEDSKLDIIIESINCSPNSKLITCDGNNESVDIGQKIEVVNRKWTCIFKFSPGKNEYGDDYCQIEYSAMDKDGSSSKDLDDVATIKININPVNQPPISEHKTVHFNETADFSIFVEDIDSDTVGIFIKECKFETSNNVTIILNNCDIGDCSSLNFVGDVNIENEDRRAYFNGNVQCDSCKSSMKLGTIELTYDDYVERNYDPPSYLLDIFFIYTQEVDGIECNGESCTVDGKVTINTTYYVTTNFTIEKETVIIIPPDLGEVFVNLYETPIEIEGGSIIIDVNNTERYNNFVREIKENTTFEYRIISGRYRGKFDKAEVRVPSEADECESIIPKINEKDTSLGIIFSVESKCSNDEKKSFPWWGILLITLFIVIGIAIVGLFIVRRQIAKRKM